MRSHGHVSLTQHHPPTWHGGIDAQTDETQECLVKDETGNHQRLGDDRGTKHVRKDVPKEDPELRSTNGTRCLDVFLLSNRQRHAAHQAGHSQPRCDANSDEDEEHPAHSLIEGR